MIKYLHETDKPFTLAIVLTATLRFVLSSWRIRFLFFFRFFFFQFNYSFEVNRAETENREHDI